MIILKVDSIIFKGNDNHTVGKYRVSDGQKW